MKLRNNNSQKKNIFKDVTSKPICHLSFVRFSKSILDKLPAMTTNTVLRDEKMPFENVGFFLILFGKWGFFSELIIVEIEIMCEFNVNLTNN